MLAVVHHRHEEWVSALREAEPRLGDPRLYSRDPLDDSWLARAESLRLGGFRKGAIARMPRLTWIQSAGAGVVHDRSDPFFILNVAHHPGRRAVWPLDGPVHGRSTSSRSPSGSTSAARLSGKWSRWAPKLLPEDLTGQVARPGVRTHRRQIGRARAIFGLDYVYAAPARTSSFRSTPLQTRGLPPGARVLVLVPAYVWRPAASRTPRSRPATRASSSSTSRAAPSSSQPISSRPSDAVTSSGPS